ncbi:MAG: ribosome maturation factor RimP [Gemmatimonadota bacterium]|jgi:ribosome maturation factor RimP
MARPVPEIERELEERVQALGFDLVQAEWAGSARRPILRLRVEVPPGSPRGLEGDEVGVDDCARVSRGLEAWLDGHASMPEKYVLEVSSPGVDRPLTRAADWDRFAGRQVAVKGPEVLVDRATRLEGELLGLEVEEDGSEVVRLRLHGGEEVRIPRGDISGAHLVFRWK